jgi:lipopolysaccharide transport system ATP-binding protein
MTKSTAIEIRNLSKRYRRGKIDARSLREELEILVNRLRSRESPVLPKEFYALKDVTFSVPVGTVCGIIGRNGSGKTTLLKVLTSITAPDAGEAVLRGRIGSLLEVGAGFHPELDGIENIYLNGAILGMSKSEITRKLDQIIEFADIGEFLETPVKRYSSGMYVRLAFSVAAHLEPEILLVDEVLAVGDAEFQRKCLGKMKNVAHEGRTVLFVTHNMAMVRQLCNMAVHLDRGVVQDIGDKSTVIDAYLARLAVPGASGSGRGGDEALWGELSIVEPGKQVNCAYLTFGRDYDFKLRIGSKNRFRRTIVQVRLFDNDGTLISTLESLVEGIDQFDFIGLVEVVFNVRSIGLLPGFYRAGFDIYAWGEDHPTLSVERALDFEIIAATVNDAHWPYIREHGIVRLASSAELRTSI